MMRPLRGYPTRREFLGSACRCGAGLAAVSALPLLQSCVTSREEPVLRIGRDELAAAGGRAVVEEGSVPIEVSIDDDGPRARSLLCTHQGCRVQWKEAAGHYHCPCHDGVFSPAGAPLQGPPREPLREFAATLRDGYVEIDVSSLRELA